MERTIFTSQKVNNEIELCEISDPECKQLIERHLLQERISYYIRWPRPSLFRPRRHVCIICVNENVQDVAEDIVRSVCDEKGYPVKFLLRRSTNQYL